MSQNHPFHHPPATLRFWRKLVTQALKEGATTPCYLFSVEPLEDALSELDAAFGHLPIRHWLSCKTQPLRPLLEWWQGMGRPIEVVSEFEYRAAMQAGFTAEQILVNGPAKHRWLPAHAVPGLWVNFDSPNELKALAPLAKKLKWRVGLRIRTSEEYDPETPEYPTQFGLGAEEMVEALKTLKRYKLQVEVLHFHLRTNVAAAVNYRRALLELRELCQQHKLMPRYIDCGGGFPPEHVLGFDGQPVAQNFKWHELAELYAEVLHWFPSCEELWLENGRWFSARSGVVVVTVLDEKHTHAQRNLICDGGRTMNALVSTWEAHELLTLPERKGRTIMTTVNGPTCMAYDKLARRPLPASIRVGDRLIWMEAGAYHLAWETRFSHGQSAILWHDGKKITQVRAAESFKEWWR